jgi:hypothetical protein
MGIDVLIPITIFGVFGWIVWTIATNIRRSKATRVVAELHTKLLDKCAASQELLGYLESEAGRRFLESASTSETNPASRILNALQGGAIILLVGVALLIVRSNVGHNDFQQFLLVSGAIAVAIGLGFLISAVASYLLCKSWGILTPAQMRR